MPADCPASPDATPPPLRTGFTTGTCAAAAAHAAALLLAHAARGVPSAHAPSLDRRSAIEVEPYEPPEAVSIALPSGASACLLVAFAEVVGTGPEAVARAGVVKDAGDDPDLTHGLTVIATLRYDDSITAASRVSEDRAGADGAAPGPREPRGERAVTRPVEGVRFAAGAGVGVVTKPGLQVPVGEPAINPTPRRMIAAAIRSIPAFADSEATPLRATISIPGGAAVAAKTFNPRLGVVGGLSIIGTTGIVRPFSHAAVRDSIACALDVAHAAGVTAPVLVPGHVGERAARGLYDLAPEAVIEVSNEWGFALEAFLIRADPTRAPALGDAPTDANAGGGANPAPPGDRELGLLAHRPEARGPRGDVGAHGSAAVGACEAATGFRRLLAVGHPGKLAKLAMGYGDTHSRASPSALPYVLAAWADLCRAKPVNATGGAGTGDKAIGAVDEDEAKALNHAMEETTTVEGFFKALREHAPDAARALGDRLAEAVRIAIHARARCPCAVVLVSMAGEVLGAASHEGEGLPVEVG